MDIILTGNQTSDVKIVSDRWSRYCSYISSIRHELPVAVREFADEPLRFDYTNSHSLHDAQLEYLTIRPIFDQNGTDEVNIEISLLGAYGDCRIKLTYISVVHWKIPHHHQRNYTWNIDEFSIEEGTTSHRIMFVNEVVWIIDFLDFSVQYEPWSPD